MGELVENLILVELGGLRLTDEVVADFDYLIAKVQMPVDDVEKAGGKPADYLLINRVEINELLTLC